MSRSWRWILTLLPSLFAVLMLASTSDATSIGPSCGTCQGSIYDLTYDPTPVAFNQTQADTTTWRITYTIDTSGYDGGGVYLNTVAVKVSSSFVDATLFSAPGGVGNWNEMSGGLAAAGCSGSGSGFDCVAFRVNITLAPAVPGGTYTWVFDIEIANDVLFPGESSVKARYVNSGGMKVGALVSENLNLTLSVPEPSTALLLAGPLFLGWRRRSRAA